MTSQQCSVGAQPLTSWSGAVAPEWVDYNGHLNDAFYMVIFSYATDGLMAQVGLDPAGRAATGHTMFTLEVHLNYVQEVHEGVAVEVRTQILGVDTKRVHLFHTLHRQMDGRLLATNEQMLSNIDVSNPSTGHALRRFYLLLLDCCCHWRRPTPTCPAPPTPGAALPCPSLCKSCLLQATKVYPQRNLPQCPSTKHHTFKAS